MMRLVQGSKNVKAVNAPTLSKSQQRKLKKMEVEVEEEKRHLQLLSKSMEALDKYKIPETTYSLLQSSRDIGRAETNREKRSKVVQFSTMGLRAPDDPDFASFGDDEAPSWSKTVFSNNQKRETLVVEENKVLQVKMDIEVLASTDLASKDDATHRS